MGVGAQTPPARAVNHPTPLSPPWPPLALCMPAVPAATPTLRGQYPSLLPSSVGGNALQIHRWQEPRPQLLPPTTLSFLKGFI